MWRHVSNVPRDSIGTSETCRHNLSLLKRHGDEFLDDFPGLRIAEAHDAVEPGGRDGKQHVGVIVGEGFDSTLTLADAQGKRTVLKITAVEERVAQTTSIMPADLHSKMTRREFLDLLAFLESRK